MQDFKFSFLDKSQADEILPELYDILYSNMSVIAPTGNSYDEDNRQWISCVLPALEKAPRRIILIHTGDILAGYFQYYINDGVLMMEDIQFRREYQGCGLFGQLYRYLVTVIPLDAQFVEAYSNKKNFKSQAILKHLGLEVIGENKNRKSYHFRGNYQTLAGKYHRSGT